jgi:hypothetical protein
MRKAIIILTVALVGIATWLLTYPSASDPKNIRYVLWKAGIYRMDPDTATETMIGDANRDKIVVGKTKLQLRDRFGYLVEPADTSTYVRGCYQNSSWKDRDVLFIRKSPWMVVFADDKATDLVFLKGC